MADGDQADGLKDSTGMDRESNEVVTTDDPAESHTSPKDDPPEEPRRRGPLEENSNYAVLQALANTPEEQHLAKQSESADNNAKSPATKEPGTTWRDKNNIFKEIWKQIKGLGRSPDEESLTDMVEGLKEQDWQDQGDYNEDDVEQFMKDWKQKASEWKLTERQVSTLVSLLKDNRDSKNKRQTIISQMCRAARDAYTSNPKDTKGGNVVTEKATTKDDLEKIKKWNNDLRIVNNPPDEKPVEETWRRTKDLAPGEALRDQSTETADRMRINENLTNAIKNLMPAVTMVTKSPITSQVITIAAILTLARGALMDPGDSMYTKDIKATLHTDETGSLLLSILWKKDIIGFNHYTEVTDFGQFSRMQSRLRNLTDYLEQEKDPNWKPYIQEDIVAKRHCDCVLTSDYPVDEMNKTWIMPHEEHYGKLCENTRLPSQNKYEVTVRTTEQGPECTITPTNKTKDYIEKTYKTTNQDLVSTLNHNRRHPCVTKGAHNLNKIPRNAITTKTTKTLIECILHCTFSQKCTNWMFHEKTKACWLLSITRKYQFAETRGHWTNIYAGEKACTPCGLAAQIELPENDRTMWESRCTLTMDTRQENPLKCPCNAKATYQNNLNGLQATVNKSKWNKIRQTIKQYLVDDLVKALEIALESQGQSLATTILSHLRVAIRTQPSEQIDIIKAIGTSEEVKRIFSNAIRVYTRITSGKPKRRTNDSKLTTNRAGYKSTVEMENLLNGNLQTNGAIKKALTHFTEILTTASTQKELLLDPPITPTHNRQEGEMPGIQIAADWGEKITKTTLTPKKKGENQDTISICPIPTTINRNLQEGPALEGELNPTTLQHNEQWKRNCLYQIKAGEPTLGKCNPGGEPKPWRQAWKLDIPHKDAPLTLVRLAPITQERTSYKVNCNDKQSTITSSGVIVAILEAGCEVRTMEGKQVIRRAEDRRNGKADYWILYDGDLQQTYTEDQITDIWQSTLIAIILIMLGTEIIGKIVRRFRRTENGITTHPQQGSPRDERSQ